MWAKSSTEYLFIGLEGERITGYMRFVYFNTNTVIHTITNLIEIWNWYKEIC
jgi:hypothetical protein